ncbi:MAG: PfkB family carbohydrate kinase [Calditrichia bacterium]
MENSVIIVPGGLNTDIIGLGVPRLLQSGELTLGGKLSIGPGGKARNMAQMAAVILGKGRVAMIGRSSRDPFGLWRPPIEALQQAGVNTDYIVFENFEKNGAKFPGIALIPVDKNGSNQIYVLPGVNENFSPEDIERAAPLFESSPGEKFMMMALEIPEEVVLHAVQKAAANHIKVILDPGGIESSFSEEIYPEIYFLKPNIHEAEILSGRKVQDFNSAGRAADILLKKGVQNVLITHGPKGGYLFNEQTRLHISVPDIQFPAKQSDETGCGDQVTAVICAVLANGGSVWEAAQKALLAGTLQFHRSGIQPVEAEVLEQYWRKLHPASLG